MTEARRSRYLERLWRDALEKVRATLGEGHPDTGVTYKNMASNLYHQGRYKEALPSSMKPSAYCGYFRKGTLGERRPRTVKALAD